MSATITVTEKALAPVEASPNIFASIHKKYADWNDPKSKNIRHWVMGLDNTTTKEKACSSLRKVLSNSIDGMPLENPVLLGNQTWEDFHVEEFYKVMPASAGAIVPYSKDTVRRTHDYVIAMIGWLNEVDPQERMVFPPPMLEVMANARQTKYQEIARHAATVNQYNKVCEAFTGLNTRLETLEKESEACNLEREKEALAEARAHREETVQRVGALVEQTEGRIAGANARADASDAKANAAQEKVAGLEDLVSQLEREKRELEEKLSEIEDLGLFSSFFHGLGL